MISRRRKFQKGSIWLRGDNFYVRYYGLDRKQKTEFLVTKDAKHHSKTCAPVKKLFAAVMARVNSASTSGVLQVVTVEAFWESTYLPFVEKNLRPSTIISYKDIWNRILKGHFGLQLLVEYRAHQATEFLSSLTDRLNRNSLNHVRSLMSGIFSHAAALGKVEYNPMRDAKVLSTPKKTLPTSWYSLGELEDVISALKDDAKAQLVVMFAGLMGLRPSEIVGLDWSDVSFTEEVLYIRRAVVRGEVGDTKTDSSVRSIPLIQPVLGLLKMWHESSGSPSTSWVFPNRDGMPMNIREFCRKKIKPVVGKKWKGLYSGRRGAASILTQLTGNPIAASQALGHINMTVTMKNYIKSDRRELASGMKLLEEKLAK
jgi:integrase